MIRQTNLSYVPRERELLAYTIYVNVYSLTARASLLGRSEPGEIEVPACRKPQGEDNWTHVQAKAEELNQVRARKAG